MRISDALIRMSGKIPSPSHLMSGTLNSTDRQSGKTPHTQRPIQFAIEIPMIADDVDYTWTNGLLCCTCLLVKVSAEFIMRSYANIASDFRLKRKEKKRHVALSALVELGFGASSFSLLHYLYNEIRYVGVAANVCLR